MRSPSCTAPAPPALVLFLLVLVWCADSAAFFVGRRYGRRRLASRVSPGKSVEGVLGAMLAGALLAGAAAPLGGVPAPLPFVALSVLTVITSVLGDLTESAFKRRAGVKDSGSLIPGHGGVLDRIDSLTAAAPLFVLGYHWLGGMQ
ncbi:MAG: phosphatidate cytidylyltransferase [Gammaproteobacteria bacterium]|nr:phosphatidate cytidylyltransferase [Gammaproteobacteria bacterium]